MSESSKGIEIVGELDYSLEYGLFYRTDFPLFNDHIKMKEIQDQYLSWVLTAIKDKHKCGEFIFGDLIVTKNAIFMAKMLS